MTFGRGTGPAPAQTQPPSTQVAVHMEEEIERRSRELTERWQAEAQQAGFDHGIEAARAEIGPVLGALAEASQSVAGSTEAALDDLAVAAVQIGLAIAETVIGHELDTDPAAFVDSVRRAVHALEGDDDVVLHLHPADAAIMRELHDRELDGYRIAEDHGLKRGECRAESAVRIALDGIGRRLDHIRTTIEEIQW